MWQARALMLEAEPQVTRGQLSALQAPQEQPKDVRDGLFSAVAKRIAPPEIQAEAHVDELTERPGAAVLSLPNHAGHGSQLWSAGREVTVDRAHARQCPSLPGQGSGSATAVAATTRNSGMRERR